MAKRAARLHAHVRSAAAMLVAPSMRRRPIAVFRRVAITRGAFPVLMVDASPLCVWTALGSVEALAL